MLEMDLNKNQNLTDSDKLIYDEYKTLKDEFMKKTEILTKAQADLNKQVEISNKLKETLNEKEAQIKDIIKIETNTHSVLNQNDEKVIALTNQLSDYEKIIKELKDDLAARLTKENDYSTEIQNLNNKIADFAAQLKEKTSEIEFLNRENNSLQGKIGEEYLEHKKAKQFIEQINEELETKKRELTSIESKIKLKESEVNDIANTFNSNKETIKVKLEDYENNRTDLKNLQEKYKLLSNDLDTKVTRLTNEINRLNKDKEQLYNDLTELKSQDNKKTTTKTSSEILDNEIDREKAVLQRLETQAITAKYETKVQYLEVEIDTLRTKIRKLLKDKGSQDDALKESQQLVKDIALKYATDSELWQRHKTKLLEKEKLYEESVDMRRELKKAADKLRQKLQSLEEQIIEKQNKHTIEKNNWETSRLGYVSNINKLEEQMLKLSTVKRSKKETEATWEKERRELTAHITNLETFIKDLQSQLSQRNTNSTQFADHYGQTEQIQSLNGENEFLKNRIKELEMMLDEMEQVKRFLFEIKEAYETDKQEWALSKDEFRTQLELKENLWIECNMRLNEIVNVIHLIQLNEPLPANLVDFSNNITNNHNNQNGNSLNGDNVYTLNNLVGGTSTLLDSKFNSTSHKHRISLSTASSLSSSNLNDVNFLSMSSNKPQTALTSADQNRLHSSTTTRNDDDILLIDTTKDRKDLDDEFEQVISLF
jgi:chromosome segregation ATPase